ncbi:MAG: hypothetical protein K0Q72_2612 [Armatimonadetes bacterium]|nr:hypothetical protein [Armatimonadota bacterium]
MPAQTGEQIDGPTSPPEGEKVYAVSYPPAMYAADIIRSREFAEALGYAWLHDEDTEFVRAFREQVRRQAELYQQWLDRD